MNSSKKQLRENLIALTSKLSKSRREQAGQVLLEKVQKKYADFPFQAICLYSPMAHEIPTIKVYQWAKNCKIKIYFPVVHPDSQMDYRLWHEYDLLPKYEKPKHGVIDQTICDFSQKTLIVVPCSGLDKRGYRLGLGFGQFDRFFARQQVEKDTVVKAFCVFKESLVDHISNEDHDIPGDLIWSC